MRYIRYTDGYKFQLEEPYQHATGMTPAPGAPGNRFVGMSPDGLLTIAAGYAWDGASGPAIDTPSFMRGSLVHDALYQLIRLGVISLDQRAAADRILRDIVRADGMWAPRAWWVHQGVRLFGGIYLAGRGQGNTVLTAP